VREVLRTLKLGGVVGVLADLNATREEGVFVDFFWAAGLHNCRLATLALRTGAVVLPGYLIWMKRRVFIGFISNHLSRPSTQ
jgi:KDO2-lipid IV(A) lauroyltransferase